MKIFKNIFEVFAQNAKKIKEEKTEEIKGHVDRSFTL